MVLSLILHGEQLAVLFFVLVLVAIVLMTAKVTGWLRPKFGRKAYLLWLVWLLFPLGFIIYIYFAEIYTGWIG